ncbi:MAG: M28 family peptidase, partial [Thermoleophilia bacterium]|nr:M28 family peptidase [Thermoleophilia bacterium]
MTDPQPLELPRLDPSFDETTAVSFATALARRFPDRSPGGAGARKASAWVAARFRDVGLAPRRDRFRADLPGRGTVTLVNVIGVVRGRSPEAIVVTAHRDNSGRGPGANDNASGTAALLELARNVVVAGSAHTFVFVSTDGGAYGAVGAERLAEDPGILRERIGGGAVPIAVLSLDALAGRGRPRIDLAGDSPRSPTPALVATADASIRRELEEGAAQPAPLAQLIDLAFPFTLHEQGPFVARGTPAVTLGTGGEPDERAEEDTLESFDADRLGELGRAAQALLLAVDEAAELARGTQSYVTIRGRLVSGWTLQFLLLAALAPFLVCTVDLFARCR